MHVLNKILCTYLSPETLPLENLCWKIHDQFPETSETGLDPPLLHGSWYKNITISSDKSVVYQEMFGSKISNAWFEV